MQRPYIGITGFMGWHEVTGMPRVLQALASRRNLPHVRDLMVGVLVSSKTLAGGTNKWPGRYPKIENIRSIFVAHPNMMNLIHYNTDDQTTLAMQLLTLVEIAGDQLHGFQLNIAWPHVGEIEKFHEATSWKQKLVLQVGRRAIEMAERAPQKLAEMVARYADSVRYVDYVLIDPSGGKGEPFSTESARALLGAIAERCPKVGLGVAGGLSADSLDLVEPLLEEFPNLSIDAEGRLRTKPADDLDLAVAERYFVDAFALFERRQKED
jgi:phosphoribosylanthranilate isomerase